MGRAPKEPLRDASLAAADRVEPEPLVLHLQSPAPGTVDEHRAAGACFAQDAREARDASGVDGESARPFLRGECPSDEILVFRHPGSYLARNIAAACALGKNRFAPG